MSEQKTREQIIIRTSGIGIAANVLLAGFKFTVGTMSNSIAIVNDAVNNLSDAMSSVITIIGTKLAGKKPDKKHPMGYGRIEYLSALIISVIVLYAGVSSLVDSIKKIIHPEVSSYTSVTFLILSAAIIVKFLLGHYFSKVGKQVSSGSLEASGSDASNDAIISLSVLASALLYRFSGISIEAWVGAVIAAMIIKSGIGMVQSTLSMILGERISPELSKSIKAAVCSFPEVSGAYDLILNSYGPDQYVGSVHIEIPDTMTAGQIDDLEREIAAKVYQEHHVALTGISVYSINTTDSLVKEMRTKITKQVMNHDGVLQMHGFHVEEKTKQIVFDIVLDFCCDRKTIYQTILNEVQALYPDYKFQIQMDVDISD
jgi:cation diffusion facilitator family transporter